MAIQNRYEFLYYVACTNGNPNGDPDMGNAPRLDPETMQGYITDVAKDFVIRRGLENAGILRVFQILQTDGLGQKIRRKPQRQWYEAALH